MRPDTPNAAAMARRGASASLIEYVGQYIPRDRVISEHTVGAFPGLETYLAQGRV